MESKERLQEYKKEWEDYRNNNADVLVEYGRKCGITGDTNFVTAEVFSRIVSYKAIRNISGTSLVYNAPLKGGYDYDTEAGTGVEAKYRNCLSDQYPTDDISFCKAERDDIVNHTGPVHLVYTFVDGISRCYDLKKAVENGIEGEWTHNKTTARDGKQITETKISFNPSMALWSTSITHPICHPRKS